VAAVGGRARADQRRDGEHVVALANDSFRAFHDGHQWRAMVYENNAVSTEFVLQSGFKPVRFADEDTLEGCRR
jgi:lysylphosphatidylglycerol synthetase-like protein (DUF2156 family)